MLSIKLTSIPLEAVYTSPLARARETAAEIAVPHHIEPREEEALKEMNFGRWEGCSFDDLANNDLWRRFNRARADTRAPGGETMGEVQARMVKFAGHIATSHMDAAVALVSHAEPLRSLIAHWLRVSLDDIPRLRIDPASVSIAHIWPGWTEVACLNTTMETTL